MIKKNFLTKLKNSFLKTKENLSFRIINLFSGRDIDNKLFEDLEEQLLISDVGIDSARKIIAKLIEEARHKRLKNAESLYKLLKKEMSKILTTVEKPLELKKKKPFIILMVGVNGVGKTTTIGKLANQFKKQNKSIMIAAGDTFRVAAIEQLQFFGNINNIPVISQNIGSDSASVIFDAIQSAKVRDIDVLIADTAGRFQNKLCLMEELKKTIRVIKKIDKDAPHEVMITIDANTGQNAMSQVKTFHEEIGLTGIIISKVDDTAKGGVIVSVADKFNIPIRYIGTGEKIRDLYPFNTDNFINAILPERS